MFKRILLALVLAALLGGSALAAQNGNNGNNDNNGNNGNNGNKGGNGNRAQLPEPSSLILLLSGVGAVAWQFRSRRK